MLRTTQSRIAISSLHLRHPTPRAHCYRRAYATSYTSLSSRYETYYGGSIKTFYNSTLTGLSPAENEFREAVWEFSARVVKPKSEVIEREGGDSETHEYKTLIEVHKEMAEMGLHGVTVPTEYLTSSLGLGLSYTHHLLAMEAISYSSASLALSYGAHSNLCVNQLSRWGSDDQRAQWIPGLLDGTYIGALAMSETGAGSDVLGSMMTVAKKGDNGYVLNGNKFWITNGPKADVFVVYARDVVEPGAKQTYTTFLVPRTTPGFSTGKPLDKFGMRGSPTCELIFEDVFLPSTSVLGDPVSLQGKGAKILMSGLDLERLVLSGGPLGIMQAAYDTAVDYVHQREQFGVRVGTIGSMQAKLAEMYTKVNTARTFVYAVARAVDYHNAEAQKQGLGPKDKGYTYPPFQRRDCAAAIMYATDKAIEVAMECMQCLGGNGYINDYPAARYLADARLYAVGAGTQEIRRWLIGREVNSDFE
ncbi:isovaleryl-CoA-dehydrogenase [Lentinula detonsa]|uniref:Isovaleryl-CoA-dehydrogenase n=1 Tax=Lentinula detonsa TaxID=2804962 RepID=A0AA38Q371_9AGAR|nr:isovaleryl-CoA-dehydrogenase [Lentinula detonsa]